jgi:hypothetical protein
MKKMRMAQVQLLQIYHKAVLIGGVDPLVSKASMLEALEVNRSIGLFY